MARKREKRSTQDNGSSSVVTVDELQQLAASVEKAEREMEVPKELRKAAFDAVKDKGYNAKAFKLCLQLRKMDLLEAQAFLAALPLYAEALGLTAQADLFIDGEQPPASQAIN